jgi:hypothetical protein
LPAQIARADCLKRLTEVRCSRSIAGMADAPRVTRAKQFEHAAREERLARALRENLHRRKDQARARGPRAANPDCAGPPVDKAASDKPPA